ncbi:MAG TPA: hypothetical protein VNQ73_11340 [Ilumatobacter sp.]|nr:hypothetical protein [Ilumatobacter sp.]
MTEPTLAPHTDPRLSVEGPPDAWRWPIRLVVALPIVVAVARAVARGWFPIGDDALLTLRAADVFTRHHPLLGSWTSASLALGTDVNNPGPLYDDLLAPFMWTFGRAFGYGPGVAIGVGAINVAAALATVWVGARLGGWRAERWMLLLVAALTWSMGSELLFDVWQPHALLLPFTLLVVLTMAVASGDTALAPLWIAVLSLVVQTHIGYAYVGAALVGVVVLAAARRWRLLGTGWRAAVTGRVVRLTAAVAAVAWVQPVWEQLFGEGQGNLSRLAASAGGGDLTIGVRNAIRLLGAVLVMPPGWTRFGFEDAVQPAPLTPTADGPVFTIPGLPGLVVSLLGVVLVVGALAGLARALREPAQRVVRWALVVALVLVVAAVATLAVQVVGVTGLGSHQVRWLFAMAAYVHVTLLWGLVEYLAPQPPTFSRHGGRMTPLAALRLLVVGQGRHFVAAPCQRRPRLAGAEQTLTVTALASRWTSRPRRADLALLGLVGVLVFANLGFKAHALGPVGDRRAADTLRPVFADLERFDPAGPVVYDVDNFVVFEPYSSAVIMRLNELGVDVRLDHEGYLRQYGPGRRADGTEQVRVFQYERDEALFYAGPGCVVSRHSAVGADEEAAVDALIEAATVDLTGRQVDSSGLPGDVAGLAEAAGAGDPEAASRVVARGLLPVLVGEQRLVTTPALDAAADATPRITDRVNTTLAVVAEPATACNPG